jgi:hypothetical protein
VPVVAICRRNLPATAVATAQVEAVLVLRIGADAALPAFLVLGALGVVLATVASPPNACPTPWCCRPTSPGSRCSVSLRL